VAQLNKLKVSYATQLADVQRLADDEAKVSSLTIGFKLADFLIALVFGFTVKRVYNDYTWDILLVAVVDTLSLL